MRISHRRRRLLLSAGAVAAVSLACLPTCVAQVRRYEPNTPTLSPYLGLTLFNNGGVPNYYAFVRPRQQQRSFNLQQQALAQRQAGEIQQLDYDVQRGIVPVAQTGTGSWFFTPGARTTYLDTSQYYPQVQVGRSGR
jgi:hypothetical protein